MKLTDLAGTARENDREERFPAEARAGRSGKVFRLSKSEAESWQLG